jgi:hypothetical protein
LKPRFEPSAQDFLDAQRNVLEYRSLFDHILDEVDGVDKQVYPVPHSPDLFYRILWGQSFRGRSFWYIYLADYEADTLFVYNIGEAGLEAPFLSRR